MEKYIFDEKNGLWYELNGDYYLPCLNVPKNEQPVGIWGQRHLRYISRYQKVRHTTLLLTGRLNRYLVEVDAHAVQIKNKSDSPKWRAAFVCWAFIER